MGSFLFLIYHGSEVPVCCWLAQCCSEAVVHITETQQQIIRDFLITQRCVFS